MMDRSYPNLPPAWEWSPESIGADEDDRWIDLPYKKIQEAGAYGSEEARQALAEGCHAEAWAKYDKQVAPAVDEAVAAIVAYLNGWPEDGREEQARFFAKVIASEDWRAT